eukprot:CAMPEP_0176470240 /NCGR_PEP_ID=MMETSP0127-20121128/40333_1 /TAXON_ID=938130 /ORGANISM="Platyophrya macrostoma, Strain WH" /LENGTH=524 /DNA_ID=CAMNT_0017864487 /DNA_START=30 /DNA_END=1604 /DNA_ORIENTATION=+
MMERSLKPDEEDDQYSKSDPSDSLYKQMKTEQSQSNNQLGTNSLQTGLVSNDSQRSVANKTPMNAQGMDANSRVGFSSQASEYRKAFYHFQRMIQSSEKAVQRYNAEFQKNLNIKTQNVLDAKGISDHFERQLFKLARNPKQVRKNWSEDETLMAYFCCLYNEDFMNLSDKAWNHISIMYPGKTPEQLKLRWQNILKVPLNKDPWTKKEDDMLEELVKERGTHWKEIAIELHSRSGSQQFRQSKMCRERWANHLDPSIKQGSWQNREDVTILREILQIGKKWDEIAKLLPGRTETSIKNRYISLLKKYKSALQVEGMTDFKDEEALDIQIMRTLIELKERDLSASSSDGDKISLSLLTDDKAQSMGSAERNKELGLNSKHQEYSKHNKFMADKILEDFNSKQENSFKDLIDWQQSVIPNNGLLQQQMQFQQNPQSNLFQGLTDQSGQQMGQLSFNTGGLQNNMGGLQNPMFANLSQNMWGNQQNQNSTLFNSNQMEFQQPDQSNQLQDNTQKQSNLFSGNSPSQ